MIYIYNKNKNKFYDFIDHLSILKKPIKKI